MVAMRRLLLALVLAAAVAAVPAAQGAQDLKLAFTSYLMVSKVHQKVPGGKPRKGDSIDFKDLLVNNTTQLGKKKGKPTAYDAGTVMYTSPTTQDIAGVTTVPGYGTLTFRGPMTQRKDGTVHIPVVKGTG